MAAYILFIRDGDITNPAEMGEYARKASAIPDKFAIKPLSIYGEVHTLEGPPTTGMVMLEFPTLAAARQWYESPEYQAAAKHRRSAANYRVILLEGTP